ERGYLPGIVAAGQNQRHETVRLNVGFVFAWKENRACALDEDDAGSDAAVNEGGGSAQARGLEDGVEDLLVRCCDGFAAVQALARRGDVLRIFSEQRGVGFAVSRLPGGAYRLHEVEDSFFSCRVDGLRSGGLHEKLLSRKLS